MSNIHLKDFCVQFLPISDLKPAHNNTRRHSAKQIKMLAKAIEKFGFNNPILIDEANFIIAGHARTEAANYLKLETIPTIKLAHLSPEQVRLYRLADNRLAELSDWNEHTLHIELQELSLLYPDFDLTITGFGTPDLDRILIQPFFEAEDYIPDIKEGTATTKKGDLWVLGEHRILCGDALLQKSYDLLLENERPRLVFTDPPYNVRIKGHVLSKANSEHVEFIMANPLPNPASPIRKKYLLS